MILKGYTLGMIAANCFIVGSEQTREVIVIDPGEEPDYILKEIATNELKVKLIVATHSHGDHIGAVAAVKEATGAPFAIHEAEAEAMARRRGGSGGWGGPPVQPDVLLKAGDVLEVGELRFQVHHTPGHSPGGICLVGHGLAFTGDTLFADSIGRTDFGGGSHQQLMDNIFEHLMVLPDETTVLPGHGPATTIGRERRSNPFILDPTLGD